MDVINFQDTTHTLGGEGNGASVHQGGWSTDSSDMSVMAPRRMLIPAKRSPLTCLAKLSDDVYRVQTGILGESVRGGLKSFSEGRHTVRLLAGVSWRTRSELDLRDATSTDEELTAS